MTAKHLEGTLSCGFTYRVPTDYLNNMELLDALNELQDDNTLSFSAVVSILFGKDGKKRLYDCLRGEDGVVRADDVAKALSEFFDVQRNNPIVKNS